MSTNCKLESIKGDTQNNHLEVFGFYKIHVNTVGASSETTISFSSTPVGAYIVGTGAFTNANNPVVQGDPQSLKVATDQEFTIEVPKYNSPRFRGSSDSQGKCNITVDLDDIIYFDQTQALDSMQGMQSSARGDNRYIGELSNLLANFSGQFDLINLTGQDKLLFDIKDMHTYAPKIRRIVINNCSNIGGELEEYVEARAAGSAPSDYIGVQAKNTSITFKGVKLSVAVRLYWDGNGKINVTENSDSPTVIYGTYNIAGGTWTYPS